MRGVTFPTSLVCQGTGEEGFPASGLKKRLSAASVLLEKMAERLRGFHPEPALFYNLYGHSVGFCFKYHHQESRKGSLSYFLQKLKEKNRSEQQRKQAYDAVSVYNEIEIKNTDQGKTAALKPKRENISRKKAELR